MERARVGVPPGERAPPTLSASGLPLSDAAHSARAISQGCGKGVAWRGCGSGGRSAQWCRGAVIVLGEPRRRSARAPTAISLGSHEHCRGSGVGWGVVRGGVGWKGGVVSSGADTYLSRRSAPDWGPSHQHPHPPGYHRGRRRQREASDAAAGSGAEPQHPENFAIFVIFCFRKNAKNFPKKFGRRPRTAPRWPLVGFPLVPVCPPN